MDQNSKERGFMIINNNTGAAMAARLLGNASSALQKSLARLSSGSKVSSASDSAAGVGMSLKFGAQVNRIQAAIDNVGNAAAYAQTQDGFLQKIGSALDRMSELSMLAQDETKTDADRALYDKEFQKLDDFIVSLGNKDFNGVSLFHNGSSLTVTVAPDGTSMTLSSVDVAGSSKFTALQAASNSVLSSASAASALTTVENAITAFTQLRANVGSNLARLEAEGSALAVQKDNISAARSRISDVDIARESANFARQQILVSSGTAMLAQANVLPQSALRLIG